MNKTIEELCGATGNAGLVTLENPSDLLVWCIHKIQSLVV